MEAYRKRNCDDIIIDCIADMHGYTPKMPGGDILLLAGDYTASNKLVQWQLFFNWLKNVPYEYIVLIAGNHDGLLHSLMQSEAVKETMKNVSIHYLCDSMVEVNGIKIWGSPWTPLFDRVNPLTSAFMNPDSELDHYFEKIPDTVDILLTHGPPKGGLDQNECGEHCGSLMLSYHLVRTKPTLHIFGHIHEQGGKRMDMSDEGQKTTLLNVSCVDQKYTPKRGCIRVQISDK